MRRGVAILAISVITVLCFAGATGAAWAADPGTGTPEQIIAHHFATFATGDLDAVMSDYADDAVLITAAGVAHGKAAIRAQFAPLVRAPQTGTAAPQRRRGPDIIEKHFTPNVAWLMWVQNRGKPNELRGVETYLIRGGKIRLETVGTVNVHPAATASAQQ
jgi:ketosteroid isomerase-like protein